MSLLTNEEQAPAHVIPLLKPSLRAKVRPPPSGPKATRHPPTLTRAPAAQGFLIGTWYLDGTELHVDALLEPGAAATRYSFQMVLDLRSRPLGRWNRLDLRAYDSVRVGSGEAVPLALKNERPFWFSKVRSYA